MKTRSFIQNEYIDGSRKNNVVANIIALLLNTAIALEGLYKFYTHIQTRREGSFYEAAAKWPK